MTTKDYFDIGRDIITTLATIAAAVAAIFGLNTWKKQIKWRIEYEAARKLYKAVLQLRDAISHVRNPWIPIAETITAVDKTKKEHPNAKVKEDAAVYHLRWNKIIEATSALQLELLEAEVLWGNEAQEITKPIKTCVGKLNAALSQLINPHLRADDNKFRDVIYETETDEFTKEIKQAVETVSIFLKPKMKL